MTNIKCEYGHYYPKEFNKNCIYCKELKDKLKGNDE